MKLKTFFISKTEQIYGKKLTVSASAFKMEVISRWTLFGLLLASAVICK